MTDSTDDTDSIILYRGFMKIRGTRYESVSGTRVRIERQKRMHKFGSGYENTGSAVPILTGSEKDARYVYEVLKEWFDD